MNLSEEQASAELLRRKRMRESLVAFAESVQIPGAPLVDDGDDEFELWNGEIATLNTLDDMGAGIDDWARRKNATKVVRSEYRGIFAPVGSSLALHHRVLLEKMESWV